MAGLLFPQHVIARKRGGAELERGEIEAFVRGPPTDPGLTTS